MGLEGRNLFLQLLKVNYSAFIYLQIVLLRKCEYHLNQGKSKYHKALYLVELFFYRLLCLHTRIFISPNVFSEGIHCVHPGYVWIDSSSRIGKRCTVLPQVLLGKKKPGLPPPCIFIGDDCYIGTGTTILGPVQIGNNVTIAAGAVVVSDIPDNCIVAGVPAKIVNYK